jgi:hypothetical protein
MLARVVFGWNNFLVLNHAYSNATLTTFSLILSQEEHFIPVVLKPVPNRSFYTFSHFKHKLFLELLIFLKQSFSLKNTLI